NRAPGKGGALVAELSGMVARLWQRVRPPVQLIARRLRLGVGEYREHKTFDVPESVPVVPGPGEALGRNRSLVSASARLEHGEEREAHRLLDFGITRDLDVGARPELFQARALFVDQTVPSRQRRAGKRSDYLIVDGG